MRSAMPQSGKYLARKGRVRELHVSCFMARLHAANPRKFDDEGETLPLVRQSEHRFLKVRKRNEHVEDVPITRRVQARRATARAFARGVAWTTAGQNPCDFQPGPGCYGGSGYLASSRTDVPLGRCPTHAPLGPCWRCSVFFLSTSTLWAKAGVPVLRL